MAGEDKKKKRVMKKLHWKGVELGLLLDMQTEELKKLLNARQRRKFNRGIRLPHRILLTKLRDAKKGLDRHEKPAPVKTHLRNVTIVPEMIGSIVEVYNGKSFIPVEIKHDMIGHYLAEFAVTYKTVRHGKGKDTGSKFKRI
eukprot:GHVP01031618.1.p2 GENE.GHVP01031618.1~~GHVP01031618.1.p2  ORF type:complete len:149 (+),score=30.13 GHVP01031618.1:24-449(+)